MKEYRDEELGQLMGRLDDSSPPAPGFEARVWARIDSDPAHAPAAKGRDGRARRRRPLLLAAVAVGAAAALVTAAVLFGLPGAGDKTGPAPVSAAAVSARMAAALSSFRTLQGTMTTSGSERYANGGTFATDAAGDFSLRFTAEAPPTAGAGKVARPLVLTYNARRHAVMDTYVEPDGKRVSYGWHDSLPYEGSGVPGWSYPFPPGYAWLVRAALADGDPRVTVHDAVLDGRPAWTVSLPATRSFGYLAGMRFAVDKKSGFLVHWTWPPDPDNRGWTGASSLTDLRVDQSLPPGTFSVGVPPGAKLARQEWAHYYCALGRVPARVGFRPFLPSYLPPGYTLSDVATDPRGAGDFLGWQGPDPGSHDAHTEAFVRYRRGADSFTVHAYSLAGISRSEVTGYLRGLSGMPAYGSEILRTSAFAGRRAQTWFSVSGANLVVVGEAYLAYISGSLTRHELYDVAGSLRQT
jgi:outer membrane lipoprotein-sorting protein